MLTKVKLEEIGTVAAYGEEQVYLLADGVLVYFLAGAMYIPADIELITAMENHTIYGFYDQDTHGDGTLRVITAVRE